MGGGGGGASVAETDPPPIIIYKLSGPKYIIRMDDSDDEPDFVLHVRVYAICDICGELHRFMRYRDGRPYCRWLRKVPNLWLLVVALRDLERHELDHGPYTIQ